MLSNHPFRILWIGPQTGALGWLRDRMAELAGEVINHPQLDGRAIARASESGLDRIVLACTDRAGYPHEALQWLEVHCPEIPVAMAQDSWWDGAGRTGLQRRSVLSLPWYRWWDGWSDWIAGIAPSLFDPCPPLHAHMNIPADVGHQALSPGLVVANCKATRLGWELAGEALGMLPTSMGSHRFLANSFPHSVQSPAWILWDDTCLDTHLDEDQQCVAFFQAARQLFPDALLCAAFGMPRWRTWSAALGAGADEIIAKPSTGAALGRATRVAGAGPMNQLSAIAASDSASSVSVSPDAASGPM